MSWPGREMTAVVAVGLVVARTNHVGLGLGKALNFISCDVSSLFLLKLGISVSKVTNYYANISECEHCLGLWTTCRAR